MDLVHDEKEPIEWRSFHVGAERGVFCEHMQALVTNIFQRHWDDLQQGLYRLILHGFHDELGREDGIRRGQARSGIKNSYLDKSPRTRGSGSAGRDAECLRFGLLRE